MPCRYFLSGIVVVLALLVLVTHGVSGQFFSIVKITQVNAPSTVVAGQPLRVSITVSYNLSPGDYLLIGILDHTGAAGRPYSITASSCDGGYTYPNESICSIEVPTGYEETLTVSFTLTAPEAQFFWLCVYATAINSMNGQVDGGDAKQVQVLTSGSVPEFPITELPILIICLTLVSIMVRKFAKKRNN